MWETICLCSYSYNSNCFCSRGYLGAFRLSGGNELSARRGPVKRRFLYCCGYHGNVSPLGLKAYPAFSLMACFLALIAATRIWPERFQKRSSVLLVALPGVSLLFVLVHSRYVFYRGLVTQITSCIRTITILTLTSIELFVFFSDFRASVFDGLLSTPQPFSRSSWYYPLAFHSFASVKLCWLHTAN